MPLLWLSIAFITGIVLAESAPFSWQVWAGLTAGCIVFIFAEQRILRSKPIWVRIRSKVPIPLGLILLFFALGGLRYIVEIPESDPSRLSFYNDRGLYTLTGVVTSPPDRREDAVYLVVSMQEITDPLENDPLKITKSVRGNARIRLPATAQWQYGDVLRFNARPVTPDDGGGFSYKEYLERQKIYTVIYFPQRVELIEHGKTSFFITTIEKVRLQAQRTIFRQLPQPESGLLSGILLGLDEELPQFLEDAYQRTGTAHIIAISGFNMAVLAGLFTTLFTRFSNRYWAAGMTLIGLTTYTIFVGGSPSVVRAAIMSIAALGGHLIGRRQMGLNSLGLTAALMCALNPLLLGDVSFQLSFAATLGLVLFAGPLKDWLDLRLEARLPEEKAQRVSGFLSEYLLFTLAAQVTTLPLIAIHFGRVSLSSLLANPLILPVQPPILILGGISTIAGMILPALGKILAMVVWVPAWYTNTVVEWLATFKGASLAIHPQLAVWILVVMGMFVGLLSMGDKLKEIFSRWLPWIIFVLVIACVLIWSIISHLPDGRLHIELIRTPDESALVLRDPDGKVVLFDPSQSVNELSAEIMRDLSPWDFEIDEVWHTSRKSIGNLELFRENIPIATAVLAPNVYQAGADQRPVQIPDGIELVKLPSGARVCNPSGVEIALAGDGEDSTALFIEYDQFRILIPNGVDYAKIRAEFPQLMENLTILILQDEDISYIPPRVWKALRARQILWKSSALSPEPAWLGNDAYRRVSLSSSGTGYTVETH